MLVIGNEGVLHQQLSVGTSLGVFSEDETYETPKFN